jgi:diguanylate cyclase (GGDEF)-like protein/PAS domain S-box-containing protein
MMENSEDYIYFKDRNHVFTAVSQTTVPSNDKRMADVIGMTDYELMGEEAADAIYRLEKQIFAGLPMGQKIHEIQTGHGRRCCLDNRMYPIKTSSGEIVGVWGIARDITERVQAEEALRESEEILRESQRVAGLGSFVMDAVTRNWKCSDVLEEIFGIDKSYPCTEEGMKALVHPDDIVELDRHICQDVFGQGAALDREHRIVRKSDQAVRWVHGLGRLEFDAQGKPLKMRGTIQDITERKQAEVTLRESEKILRESQRAAGLGSFVIDYRTETWKSSDVLDEIFGIEHEPKHMEGELQANIYPEDRDRVQFHWKKEVYRDGKDLNLEYRIVRPCDGVVRWVHALGRLEFDAQGQPVRTRGTIQDITEHKQADAALRESKELLQLFIKHAPVGLAMFDREMRFLAVSGCYLEEASLVGREIIGHCLYEIFPGMPESLKETHRRGLAEEAMQSGEDRQVRANGTMHWSWWGLHPWRTGNGAVGGIVLFTVDITKRKQAEEMLRESEESLRESQNIAGLGSYVMDIRTGAWRSSEILDKLFGIDQGHEHTLEGWLSLTHPKDRTMMILYFTDEVLGQGRSFDKEYRIVRSVDQAERWVHGLGKLEFDAQGQPVKMRGTIQDITERKQADEALRENKELLQNFVEHAPASLAMFDREMRYLVVSHRYLVEVGLVGQEIIGHTNYEIEPWIPESWREDHRRGMAGEVIQRDGDRLIKPDGIERWIRWGVFPWRTGNGDVGGIIITGEDITERRQAEVALRESKELFQLFIEHAPVGLAMFDREMRYLAASSRYLEEASLVGREIIGHPFYEIFPEVPEHVKEAHRRGLAGEAARCDGERLELPDGTVRWIRWELHPWLTGNGAVGGVVLFVEEITEQRKAEERLRLAARVFTHASEGILITAPDGAILDVNDTFTQITGYTREEVLGRNPRLLNSGRQGKEFYTAMWRTLLEKGHWSGEIWNRGKDGRIYAEMLTISAVQDESGEVQQYVALFSDITTFKEHEQQLRHIAHYDVLTGLPNRVLLADRLNLAMAQFPRLNWNKAQPRLRGQVMAVAYLDLDGFKEINDSHGHDVGDQVLAMVGRRMKKVLRKGDTLARLGGDEFVAVLLDLETPEASIPMLNRMLKAASQPMKIGDHDLQVSVSIGVTFYPQAEGAAADQLLRQADQAMYQAKLAGKNSYHLFDISRDRSARGHQVDLVRFRQALEAREFVLYYQPKVNMRKGTVEGAEALIRWKHPERGLMLPGTFLPAIEDHPLAVELGEWVIDTALTQMERWQAAGLVMPVSVNVGARQLQEPDFVDRLAKLLAAHPRVKPTNLELEILETSAVLDMAHVSEMLEGCRQMGVTFSLDDFGTGYSSLSYLKHLPVDVLKIDRSFVRDILDDPEDLNILAGILGLATAFRRQVVAEGVETVDHGLMLIRMGCELAQGFGIAHPMPAGDFPDWAAAWRPDPSWVGVLPASQNEQQLLYATVEHRAWIEALESFLKDERHIPPRLRLDQCRFSAWKVSESLAGRGKSPEFQALDDLHRQIHALAVDIVKFRDQDHSSESLARLGELHRLRDAILNQLELYKGS